MTGADQPPVASVSDLILRYGKVTALDRVTLDIPAGMMVGLIGPDGVGKSSLLSLLAGARVIQDGGVHVLGGDMRDAGHRSRVCPRIAYMPQGLGKNLYPTLSVEENLEFFGRLFGHDKAERDRRILDLLVSIDPDPEELDAALMGIVGELGPPTGPTRAICGTIRDEWEAAAFEPGFAEWLIEQALRESANPSGQNGKRRRRPDGEKGHSQDQEDLTTKAPRQQDMDS